jgi:broad specificity phosphatase PhoE
MNRLYLVRHGENPANLTKEFSHRLVDYALTPKGVLQAQQTADYLAHQTIDSIYASPLKRARETAQVIAERLNLAVVVLEGLREVNVGNLEGQPPSTELWKRHNVIIADWLGGKPETCFPSGEDYVTLYRRTEESIKQMLQGKEDRHIVAVGHGGMFTFTLQDLCRNVDLAWLRQAENHNCSITEIDVEQLEGKLVGTLVRWASVDHLHGQAADFVPGMVQTD